MCYCVLTGTIPDESKAVQLAAPASAVAGGFTGSSGGLLPTPPIPAQVCTQCPIHSPNPVFVFQYFNVSLAKQNKFAVDIYFYQKFKYTTRFCKL